MTSRINPGDGYRLVEVGEIVLPTDEFSWTGDDDWITMDGQGIMGHPYKSSIAPTRRRLEKARKQREKKLIVVDVKADWRLA